MTRLHGRGAASEDPIRIVLDTNVTVSALLFATGRLAWLRQSWLNKRIIPVVCRETVTELMRVLSYPKFKLARAEQEALLSDYLPECETIVLLDLSAPIPACRDPHDEIFLHLALTASVNFLVTGDDDLLTLAAGFSVPIISPAQLKLQIYVD